LMHLLYTINLSIYLDLFQQVFSTIESVIDLSGR
jgi:hypothetical protein